MFTFLHISDLHRSPTDPISNAELLSCITADSDKHCSEQPAGSRPDAVIVSGDLIQGVGLGVGDARKVIEEQYQVAMDFLEALAQRFLDGDRSRVVIVPGNHDVDWNQAHGAMVRATDEELPRPLGALAFSSREGFRWSWKERQAYRIADSAAYEERLLAFRTFYNQFYAGTERRLAQIPYDYFDLFEFHEGRIAVAGFNSCFGNDCFCFGGHIPEDAIAKAHLTLRERAQSAELRIAVWHHNIEGPPTHDDYMDTDAVNRMIGVGFRLGLHGHQHRAQLGHRYVLLPEEERMAVVSAGSLCAGTTDRPTGVNRQYNIIQLDDDLAGARIHIREMTVATVFGPAMRAELGGKGYADLSWNSEAFRRQAATARVSNNMTRVSIAERAWKEGRPAEAKEILLGLEREAISYQRSLLLNILEENADWAEIVLQVPEPLDISELTLLTKAHVERHNFVDARKILDRWADPMSLPQPQRNDLDALINARELMEP